VALLSRLPFQPVPVSQPSRHPIWRKGEYENFIKEWKLYFILPFHELYIGSFKSSKNPKFLGNFLFFVMSISQFSTDFNKNHHLKSENFYLPYSLLSSRASAHPSPVTTPPKDVPTADTTALSPPIKGSESDSLTMDAADWLQPNRHQNIETSAVPKLSLSPPSPSVGVPLPPSRAALFSLSSPRAAAASPHSFSKATT
jgi:hypothetical protein